MTKALENRSAEEIPAGMGANVDRKIRPVRWSVPADDAFQVPCPGFVRMP
jgi:hypothetical protein